MGLKRKSRGPGAPQVTIRTLGCKVNQYDAAALEVGLTREGFEIGPADGEAQVVIVNTCTVTSATDRQNRQLIRRLRAGHPDALLVVTGCQAEAFPEAVRSMPEVNLVVGNRDKGSVPRLILLAMAAGKGPGPLRKAEPLTWDVGLDRLPGHTRAFLKVQDGCDASCTYCIVPRARGPSRSRPIPSVLEGLGLMEGAGVQEVVLTGIHLGDYGKDLDPPSSLVDLLRRLLASSSVPRIRLSSVEPLEAQDDVLTLLREAGRICPHLHLPLQSGDDELLGWMKRPYTTAQYAERVLRAASLVPDLTIGCDVIVGFPGESEAHFRRTLHFLRSLPLTYLHVFPFSPRPGTPAASLPQRVAPAEIKARARTLRDFSQTRRSEAMAAHLGRVLPVLLERPVKGRRGWMEGFSHNYLKVVTPGGATLRNRIVPIRMERVDDTCLVGTPAHPWIAG